MSRIKRGFVYLLTILLCSGMIPGQVLAVEDISGNEYIIPNKVPSGKTGKTMTISFTFKNSSGRDLENIMIGFSQDVDLDDDEEMLKYGYTFPFEVHSDTFNVKNIGKLKENGKKTVSFSARVRRDLPEGYYSVPFQISADSFDVNDEYVNIWIQKSATTEEDDDVDEEVRFRLGEDQSTPYGIYPNVLNFNVNMRNASVVTAQDVTVSLNLSKDKAEFPFDINDGNYDRHYDRIGANEVVELPYSMAIREDVYSGYYPLKYTITYRESSQGELKTAEEIFYVKIKNKDEDDDDLGEFNQNDRTKARIIVDSFETIPAEIIAGEPFELILRMKNASSTVAASNILFSLESEKVSESAVFSTESGSSSIVVNQLGAGEVTELRYSMLSKAGVDQRPYSLTINEQFDSPEFKNAEEKVVIDIPIKQLPRLNVGTIEVMPDSINVGGDSNVMFSINNLGKVTLYNVLVTFEADSIQSTDAYVGNIKPGESGNVDVMLNGIAPTADDGKVKIIISYEDENAHLSEEVKELNLYVMEDIPMDYTFDDEMMGEPDQQPKKNIWELYRIPIIAGAVAAAAAGLIVFKKLKKRKQLKQEEGFDDEIY